MATAGIGNNGSRHSFVGQGPDTFTDGNANEQVREYVYNTLQGDKKPDWFTR